MMRLLSLKPQDSGFHPTTRGALVMSQEMENKGPRPFPIDLVEPFDSTSGDLNAVIEVPKYGHYKYKYDPHSGLFKLARVLPVGAVFPFDFGFIPGTLGGDDDPLDVLVLMDEPAFVGCLVPSRLVGVIEANQTEEGKTVRNDRLIAVAAHSNAHREIRSINELSQNLVNEIEHFFIFYNEMSQKRFQPIKRSDASTASELVQQGIGRYRNGSKG
jgi:inorganic pyrophosphatase